MINWRMVFSAAIGFLVPAFLFTIFFTLEKGNYGSLADWASAVGTIGAVIASFILAFDKRKSERKAEEEQLRQEIIKLERVRDNIENARAAREKKGSFTLQEMWKDQIYDLEFLYQILIRECYSPEAHSVILFIEYINKASDKQIQQLNDQLARPILKLEKIISDKNKILKTYN